MIKQIKHIAFIMDGNGRYAKELGKPRTFGHLEGAKRIPEIILECKANNIKYISFFAFSTENWDRSEKEVSYLMKLVKKYLSNKTLKWLVENEINLKIIGFYKKIPDFLKKEIDEFKKKIASFNYKTTVCICFNYGSRDEIIHAIKKMVENNYPINKINFEKCLLTTKIPDVDLLIRTSGEQRVSNFMLWQIAYSEIIFEKTYWPLYTKDILKKNIIEYYKRDRRFGKVDE